MDSLLKERNARDTIKGVRYCVCLSDEMKLIKIEKCRKYEMNY